MRLGNILTLLFSLILLLGMIGPVHAQPNIDEGKSLFKEKCAQCHNKNMRDDLTGPALGGAEDNWADYPREDLYAWIRNSQALISTGHPRATELFDTWDGVLMNPNPDLSDEQIESVLAYVNDQFLNAGQEVADQTDGAASTQSGNDYTYMWWLIGGLALLAIILAQIMSTLRNVITARQTGAHVKPTSILDILTSKSVIGIALFFLVVFLGFRTVNSAIDVGRQHDYAPDQPIRFSHEMHAGLQQIDCQYCHDGARRSKQSIIPATNTCMNCHKAVKKGSTYGTGELTKVFASIGFNPMTDKYIEHYDSLSEDEIKAIYTKWMATEYMADEGLDELDHKGTRLVNDQWLDLKTSLTNEEKTRIQGPIEWVRVHNLPDHVFFSHEQHVTAGQLECQTCHGKVEDMEVLSQHAPLSMGWCINCHRSTEVIGFKEGNEYYANTYKKYHDALESGEMSKVTVDQIGGIECQKCHY